MARLNEMIKIRRKELGMTLLQLSEKMDVKEATVQRWESGNIKTIKYETIERLAHALNCTPQYLMGWEDKNDLVLLPHDEAMAEINKYLSILSPEKLNEASHFLRFLTESEET